MLDMYRQPEKLSRLCEKLLNIQVKKFTRRTDKDTFSMAFTPLHRGSDGFMSLKQFETFYWPYVKRMVNALVELDITPYIIFEGDYTSRLEHVLELPKAKVLCHFDAIDMTRVKAVLGDHTAIMGNVPASLLQTGSVQDVKNYCKKLIDTAGKGGGFVMSPRSAIDEAKPENIQAMIRFTQEYGVYR
jgi:uroporphyrinogen-III decarboxylase